MSVAASLCERQFVCVIRPRSEPPLGLTVGLHFITLRWGSNHNIFFILYSSLTSAYSLVVTIVTQWKVRRTTNSLFTQCHRRCHLSQCPWGLKALTAACLPPTEITYITSTYMYVEAVNFIYLPQFDTQSVHIDNQRYGAKSIHVPLSTVSFKSKPQVHAYCLRCFWSTRPPLCIVKKGYWSRLTVHCIREQYY